MIAFKPAVVPAIVAGNPETTLWVHLDARCSMVTPSSSPNQRPGGPCYVCGVDGPWALLYFRVVDGAVDTQPVPETTEDVEIRTDDGTTRTLAAAPHTDVLVHAQPRVLLRVRDMPWAQVTIGGV